MKINRLKIICLLSFLSFFSCEQPGSSPISVKYNYPSILIKPVSLQAWYFSIPSNIAIDNNNNVYIYDRETQRILKFNTNGFYITDLILYFPGPDDDSHRINDIAFNKNGDLYVTHYDYIYKFRPDGTLLHAWGGHGTGDGEFDDATRITVDADGYVYVIDNGNNRVQKFTSDGAFVLTFGGPLFGDTHVDGKFRGLTGIEVDALGFIYVCECSFDSIQKFSPEGEFLLRITTGWQPRGIAIGTDGNLYVGTYYDFEKYTSEGEFVYKKGSDEGIEGEFGIINDVATDSDGNIYIADTYRHRVPKLSPDGTITATFGSDGASEGSFYSPQNLAVDDSGNIYVADTGNNRIQKLYSDGSFISEWGTKGNGEGQFHMPSDLAIDSEGNIFVVDTRNSRIQKFNPEGKFLGQWSGEGHDEGRIAWPHGLAIDADDNIYVLESESIKKFTPNGTFLFSWGSLGRGRGKFGSARAITIDKDGIIYVLDSGHIYKFSSKGDIIETLDFGDDIGSGGIAVAEDGKVYVTNYWNTDDRIVIIEDGVIIGSFGERGIGPGQVSWPKGIEIGPEEAIYIAEEANNRIQVFVEPGASITPPLQDKAIILAGGGPYSGNTLWDATQLVANFAYRVLTFQGFTKENIYYLTSDSGLDLDGNGKLDDVDADATNENFEYAITQWAAGADNVVVYITDHGGDGCFRMSGDEELFSKDFGQWINNLNNSVSGMVTVVYDACESGSFFPDLVSGEDNTSIVITSSKSDEEAYFLQTGTISFSFYFWSYIFNGANISAAFLAAGDAMETHQTSLLDANGNGIPNEAEDFTLAGEYPIGIGAVTAGDIPTIGSISPDQLLSSGTSTTVWVDNIIPSSNIQKVWAVVVPPEPASSDPSEPVTDLPSFDLVNIFGNRYEGTYSNFTESGTYKVSVYVMDNKGNVSLPVQTTVIKNG